MVHCVIAIESVPWRPIFEKCPHLREKGGVLTKIWAHGEQVVPYSIREGNLGKFVYFVFSTCILNLVMAQIYATNYCTIQKTLIRRFVSLYIGTYCTFVCATLFPGIQLTALYSRKQNCTYKSMTDQKTWGSQVGDWM